MAVTLYKSSDGGAPTLSGTAGDLVTVLDAILRTGYGAKPAAGWTKPFTGVNKAAFRQGGGNQYYLRVQDDAPGAGVAREARLRGFETMTDVDTGTGDFPTVAQQAAGIIGRKSNTADATTRAWIAVADNKTLYFFVLTGDVANNYFCFMFGDIFSMLAGDAYRTQIIGRVSENSASAAVENLDLVTASISVAASLGHYIARAYTGAGTALQNGKHGDSPKSAGSARLIGAVTYPNPVDGGLYISPVWVHEPTNIVRGRMRGFWHFLHVLASVADGDTFSGTGTLAGKSFLVIKQSGGAGLYVMETSDTWESN